MSNQNSRPLQGQQQSRPLVDPQPVGGKMQQKTFATTVTQCQVAIDSMAEQGWFIHMKIMQGSNDILLIFKK
jgi:hypothetical protein